MNNKNSAQKYNYLFAFILGAVLMLVMYILFELTTKPEYRVGYGIDTEGNPETGQIYYEDDTYTPIIKTSQPEIPPVSSAFLGVEIIPVDSVIAKQLNIPDKKGVLINNIIPNSAAERAGLARGDVIIALNNRTVKDADRFKEIIAELKPADKVRIVYVRNEKKDSTYAVLTEAPSIQRIAQTTDSPGLGQRSDWGVSLSPLSSTLRQSLQIPSDINGIAVLSVTPGANADKSGLMPGDVITGIDKSPITDMDDFFKAIISDKDNTALLDIYSQGRRRYVPIDSFNLKIADQIQTRDSTTLRQKLFSIFTGGTPFTDDKDDEEGPKAGKFADDNISLTADNVAFNRPSSIPGDTNTGGMGPSDITGMNRPSEVPPQTGGPTNDIVLFIGLLLMIIIYLAYREFHRPQELD